MNIDLRNPILATIIYYDIFDYPLTSVEVHKFLINPARLISIRGGLSVIDIDNVIVELDRLVRSGIVGEKNGFYFLEGRESICDTRMRRNKIGDQKWKKFLKQVRFLALAPYVRGVFASGSMAINNTDDKSDFDVLIIAKGDRLYTCRFFLWLITSTLGIRRKKNQKTAPDKLCFNHFITDQRLDIGHESIFNAQTYANLKPVLIGSGLVDSFYGANLWINNYLYNFKVQKEFVRRSAKVPYFFKLIARLGELILNSVLGDFIESLLKYVQQRKIKNNPVTYKTGGRIVFNDKELEFHPSSFEKIVIEKYNKGLARLGIFPLVKEVDSGLNT